MSCEKFVGPCPPPGAALTLPPFLLCFLASFSAALRSFSCCLACLAAAFFSASSCFFDLGTRSAAVKVWILGALVCRGMSVIGLSDPETAMAVIGCPVSWMVLFGPVGAITASDDTDGLLGAGEARLAGGLAGGGEVREGGAKEGGGVEGGGPEGGGGVVAVGGVGSS